MDSGGGGFNLTMLMDFYELTMANGYFGLGRGDRVAYFDMFFRRVPDGGGYAVMAGVEQLADYLSSLRFSEGDIAYLHSKGCFCEGFLDYLRDFEFACDVWAIPEGTPIFPNEPIVKVRGPIVQAQMIETMVLLTINHQSLIATKANRICSAADGRPVSEFGSRRAQGGHGAIMGARAAYIGGCAGTACVIAERDFGIPATGTMAHSWVQSFDTELEAFEAYADLYPDRCVFLVDTYDAIRSGVPNAIKAMRERLAPSGRRAAAIRIDSGDITYLSKTARRMLDDAGFPECKILASNSLDEYIIRDIIAQGARVDLFGVGERLITSESEPVFGGVYKLAALERAGGGITPKLKISENVEKITIPGDKQVFRLYQGIGGGRTKAVADVIALAGERIDEGAPYELFDPDSTWKRKTVAGFTAKPLLEPVFVGGARVHAPAPLHDIRAFCEKEVGMLWEEVRRFENPQKYYVDLSQKLWDLKYGMLHEMSREKEPADSTADGLANKQIK